MSSEEGISRRQKREINVVYRIPAYSINPTIGYGASEKRRKKKNRKNKVEEFISSSIIKSSQHTVASN